MLKRALFGDKAIQMHTLLVKASINMQSAIQGLTPDTYNIESEVEVACESFLARK